MSDQLKGIDGIMNLCSSYPELVEFTKIIPYGLVIEQSDKNNIVEIAMQRSYSVLSVGSSSHPLASVPALERVNITARDNISFQEPFENHNLNELVWLYSFAKAKIKFPHIEFAQLCDHIQKKWQEISSLIIGGSESGIFSVYACCFSAYGHPLKNELEPFADDSGQIIWYAALTSNNFHEFMSKIGLDDTAFFENENIMLPKPRKRLVIHKAYGRVHGIMATDQGEFAKSVNELKGLALWSSENPLMFADHDLDKPIGLVYNPHFYARGDKNEVQYTLILTNENQWKNRFKYKGSSLGMYHD